MIQFGMPTLVENRTLEDNVDLCRSLGLKFIELNMNFPEYQVEQLEQIDSLQMLLVDDVDNKEFLRELLESMYEELPAPKKEK